VTLPGTERPAGADERAGIAHGPGGTISAAERERVSAAYARYEDAGAAALYSRFNPAHLFLLQECERRMLRALRRSGRTSLHEARILEVGCGTGQWLRQLLVWGAQPSHLAGVDLLERRVEEARRLLPDGVALHAGSAGALPHASASCDLVLQVTLFTSVLDAAERRRIAGEMTRVVKPSGAILWYDFHVNNPRNPDVRGVTAREIRALFPSCTVELERITLAPPLARAIVPRSWLLASLLARVPLLCTHLLGVITPSRQDA
jgi:ubiquinone/menaquinone biosynthesis C-methylase UbiE